jgi:hypothetical protein
MRSSKAINSLLPASDSFYQRVSILSRTSSWDVALALGMNCSKSGYFSVKGLNLISLSLKGDKDWL